MKKITLIHPYYNYYESYPLGLAYISSSLKTYRKCDVQIIDCSAPFNPLTDEDVMKMVDKFSPDLIGFYINNYQAINAYRLASKLKTLKKPLIAGGPHASAVPDEVLEYGFNIIGKGECEETMLDIVDWLDDKKELAEIKGIYFKDNGRMIFTGERRGPGDLDSLPLPDHDQFPLHYYIPKDLLEKGEFYFKVSISRGCPFQCTFCTVFGGRRFRTRTPAKAISEIKHYIKKYNIKYINFVDPAFTLDRNRIIEFCDLIIADPEIDIKWCIDTRVDMVDPVILTKMREAGCTGIIYGVESGNEETLRKINKRVTLKQVKEALDWTIDIGITVSVNSIIGFPWETKAHIEDTKQLLRSYAKKLNMAPTYNVPLPYSGTQLYSEYHQMYGFSNWWLKEDYLYSVKSVKGRTPYFFRVTPFIDHFMLRKNFFKYSPEFSRYLYRTIIGNCLYIKKENVGRVKAYLQVFLGYLSLFLYKLSPSFEYYIVGFIEWRTFLPVRQGINKFSIFMKNKWKRLEK